MADDDFGTPCPHGSPLGHTCAPNSLDPAALRKRFGLLQGAVDTAPWIDGVARFTAQSLLDEALAELAGLRAEKKERDQAALDAVRRADRAERERDAALAEVNQLRTDNAKWLVVADDKLQFANEAATANIASLRAQVTALQAHTEETLQRRLFNECEQADWDPEKRNTFAEECAHLHEEISEAFREWRLTKNAAKIWYTLDGKPQGIPIEFADVLIGLFYNAELHGFDLLEAVEIKHQWNLRRDYQAEGRALHPISEVSSD